MKNNIPVQKTEFFSIIYAQKQRALSDDEHVGHEYVPTYDG